ncbi:MAG: TIGR01777 family protein [Hahellaceae bacterium]|nr:TIGR01777 family protein [Hahellaceae bacterium]MCP5211847.1 TIGR01777 family protein [Hahellaceae bacterium]
MHILLTGGTGFIGRKLAQRLHHAGHSLTLLTRQSKNEVETLFPFSITSTHSLSNIGADTTIDAIINLAGAPIADRRWSTLRKQLLINSRVDTTADVVALVKRLTNKPKVLINGSAVGYYGDQGSRVVKENTPAHDEFTHQLCKAWENKANECKTLKVRVALLRTGLVLGDNGGFLKKMLPAFKLGLGGSLGAGNQYMPWIHLNDIIEIIIRLLEDEKLFGPINATAPNPVTNSQFTKILGTLLHRPTFLTLPGGLLQLIFGEMARLLTTGQKAVPQKLIDNGFKFQYENLSAALTEVLTGK